MTDKQVALRLIEIQKQLLELQADMVATGGFDAESIGVLSISETSDSLHDVILDFGDSGDCLDEIGECLDKTYAPFEN